MTDESPRTPQHRQVRYQPLPAPQHGISRRDVVGALAASALSIVAAPAILRNRYRLFGKRSNYWVAPPEYHDRIL